MRVLGYLEHLNLGIDPESGERNVLVQSAQEYQALTPAEKERAWALISIASEILEVTGASLYKSAYNGNTPYKTIKKNEFDRRGLTIVKIPSVHRTKAVKREADIQRIVRVLRRSLKATSWPPSNQKLLIEVIVSTKLRSIERELFGGKETKDGDKGITEGNHEQEIAA
jgi:hypothetical protein